MKQWIIYLFLLFGVNNAYSQDTDRKFIRFYADNDAFVPSNNATDWGYTSGIRIDLFRTSSLLYGVNQGINSYNHFDRINTAGWGLMQLIYAPQKTSLVMPDKSDYPYSGALVLIKGFHSSYSKRKLNVFSECVAGVMGPPSLGKQTHIFFHRLINDPKPMGWDYQLPTDLLLNFNVKVEKELLRSKTISLLGHAQIRAGTMNDGMATGVRCQLGNKYLFSGLTDQYFSSVPKKWRAFIYFDITTDLTGYNAVLQGGLLNKHSPVRDKNSPLGTDRKLQHASFSAEFFVHVGSRKFAIEASQKYTTSELHNYGHHNTGNLSLFVKL